MSAFNNYCAACDQLIPTEIHMQCNKDTLYCSEKCKLKDISVLSNGSTKVVQDSGSSNNNRSACCQNITVTTEIKDNISKTTFEEADSLIKSPLLIPVDNQTDNSDSCYSSFEITDWSLSIPRFYINDKNILKFAESAVDHTAENNYKLWLNSRH